MASPNQAQFKKKTKVHVCIYFTHAAYAACGKFLANSREKSCIELRKRNFEAVGIDVRELFEAFSGDEYKSNRLISSIVYLQFARLKSNARHFKTIVTIHNIILPFF